MAMTVPPTTERWVCDVYDLPEREDGLFSPVSRVRLRQRAGVHPMTISTLAFSSIDVEPGRYDCLEIYEAHPEMMEEAIVIYGSQDDEAELVLPEGVVAQVPEGIRIVHELHFVNVSEEPVEVWSTVNAYTIPDEEVQGQIWGFAVNDTSIHIPPRSEPVEWGFSAEDEMCELILAFTPGDRSIKCVVVETSDGELVGG